MPFDQLESAEALLARYYRQHPNEKPDALPWSQTAMERYRVRQKTPARRQEAREQAARPPSSPRPWPSLSQGLSTYPLPERRS